MSGYGNVEMVIRTERKVVAFRLILSAVIMAAIAGSLYLEVPEEYSPWVVGFVVVGWLCFVSSLLRIFATGTAFILTDRGLLAHVGDIDFVAWGEIENAHIVSGGGPEVIKLDLRDSETVLARLSVFRRALLRWYIKRYGEKPSLYASFAEGGAVRLLPLIQQRIVPEAQDRFRSARHLKSAAWCKASDSRPKQFTGLWRIVTIAYFGVTVIALYGYWRGGWDWGPLPLAAFAPIPISLGLLAIYTGEFQMRGGAFYRSKNPIWYWACVVTILSIGIVLFLAGIGVIGT